VYAGALVGEGAGVQEKKSEAPMRGNSRLRAEWKDFEFIGQKEKRGSQEGAVTT